MCARVVKCTRVYERSSGSMLIRIYDLILTNKFRYVTHFDISAHACFLFACNYVSSAILGHIGAYVCLCSSFFFCTWAPCYPHFLLHMRTCFFNHRIHACQHRAIKCGHRNLLINGSICVHVFFMAVRLSIVLLRFGLEPIAFPQMYHIVPPQTQTLIAMICMLYRVSLSTSYVFYCAKQSVFYNASGLVTV